MLTEVESLKQSDICCVLLLPLLVVAGCRRRRRRVLRARTCRTVSPHPGRIRTKIEAQRLQNQSPEATKSTPEAPKSTPESPNRHRKFQNRPRRVTRHNNIQKSHSILKNMIPKTSTNSKKGLLEGVFGVSWGAFLWFSVIFWGVSKTKGQKCVNMHGA